MNQGMRFDDDRPDQDDSEPRIRVGGGFTSGEETKPWLFATAGAALLGASFAGVSTHDFITHLDRQMHSIHCSFIPGAGQQLGESGCRAVMMSPYSSLFRTSLWGGLPISLLALGVFAYLVYRALDFALRANELNKKDTLYLVFATLLPVLMSVIYGFISSQKLDTFCKLCVGIYATSAACLAFAVVAHIKAPEQRSLESPVGRWIRWFLEGVAYIAVLSLLYVVFAPQSDKSAAGCGALVKKEDPNNIMLDLGGRKGGAPSIAVLDPLCPSCKAFDERLEASALYDRLDVKVVLFPLDATCNWMVKPSLHPGACAVSEAMLCEKDNARAVLAWAFENQAALLESAKESDAKVRSMLQDKFPKLKGCLGTPAIKAKLNKSLRWTVANALPVLTPQLFIGEKRVCDEDTDLGLEYTIAVMLEDRGAKAGR
jgi:uncharacterized membrane protein